MSQVVFYTTAGLSVLLCSFSFSPVATELFGGIARGSSMAATAATWVASPELYKTDIRATGHSICNAVARVGAMISPFIVLSSLNIQTVGVVLCVTNLLAAAAAKCTPETAGLSLFDRSERTKAQVEVS